MKETEREEYRSMIGSLMRAINVHPDCTDGSEFDDYAQAADDLLFKYQKLLPDVDETPTSESRWPTEEEIEKSYDTWSWPDYDQTTIEAWYAAIGWVKNRTAPKEAAEKVFDLMKEEVYKNENAENENAELRECLGELVAEVESIRKYWVTQKLHFLSIEAAITKAKSLLNKTDL